MKKLYLLFTIMLATSMGLLAQGTTWQTATLISSGQTKTATLDANTNEVWYKINVTTEGKVEFTATASQGLLLYQNYTTFLGYKNDNVYSWGNFTGSNYSTDNLTYTATNVGKGTFYVRIRRYSGEGTLTLKYKFTRCALNNDAEPNNDFANATLLQSGTTAQARLGYRSSDDVTDTDDWYKIEVPQEGRIELVATATENLEFYQNYTTFYGYKNENVYTWGNFTGSNYHTDTLTYTATNVGKGTYYIRIHRYGGSGGYRLYYKFTPCPLEADREPNNDYQRYCKLVNGKITQGRLGYRSSDDVTDTEDWYRIIVPKDGDIEVTVTATEDLTFYRSYCQIYIFQGESISLYGTFSAEDWYSPTVTYTATNIGKGTYYIRIRRNSGSGGYYITYNGPVSDVPGDVDGDGEVGIADISDLIDYLLNGDASGTLANGDVDGDNRITIADVAEVIDILLGN